MQSTTSNGKQNGMLRLMNSKAFALNPAEEVHKIFLGKKTLKQTILTL